MSPVQSVLKRSRPYAVTHTYTHKTQVAISCGSITYIAFIYFFIHGISFFLFLVVQLVSHVQLFATLWTAAWQASQSLTFSQSLFNQLYVHLIRDVIQTFHLLSPPSLPSFNLSQHEDLANESAICIRWPKHWNFHHHSFQLVFKVDFLDLKMGG